MKALTRVDQEGIPCVVQQLCYDDAERVIKAKFCNSLELTFPLEEIPVNRLGIIDREPTETQWTRISGWLERHAQLHWFRYFGPQQKGVDYAAQTGN